MPAEHGSSLEDLPHPLRLETERRSHDDRRILGSTSTRDVRLGMPCSSWSTPSRTGTTAGRPFRCSLRYDLTRENGASMKPVSPIEYQDASLHGRRARVPTWTDPVPGRRTFSAAAGSLSSQEQKICP
jgi:hypothetical protein